MSSIRRVALVGLSGSGKSSVGAALAGRLGWTYVDTDSAIEAAEGKPAGAMLEARGEPAFRESELRELERALAVSSPVVIACGGGLMTQDRARALLLERTCVVWLDAPDRVLLDRVGEARGRPLLRNDPAASLAAMRAVRQAGYATAHLRLRTEAETVDRIAERIAGALEGALTIEIPGRAYQVAVAPGALATIPHHLPGDATRAAVIADRAVLPQARQVVRDLRAGGFQADLIALTGGERVKSWAHAGRLLDRLTRLGLERRDCVVALGGGTVGDLAGFVAASYLRGIPWVAVPTTLLAMVDSAVGGKTGVNLARGKNLAGAFWQPRAVVCDPTLLRSLPDRAFRAAFAEIVKYSMVGNGVTPSDLEQHLEDLLRRDPDALAEIVRACCAAKGAVVAADEREGGLRAILNYGHTVGHALEAVTGYSDDLWHGEGVAVGMRVAGRLSVLRLDCPVDDISWQDAMLTRCGLGNSPDVDVDAVMARLNADKKAVAGTVRWVLLEGRARPVTGQRVPEDAVRDCLSAVLAA